MCDVGEKKFLSFCHNVDLKLEVSILLIAPHPPQNTQPSYLFA